MILVDSGVGVSRNLKNMKGIQTARERNGWFFKTSTSVIDAAQRYSASHVSCLSDLLTDTVLVEIILIALCSCVLGPVGFRYYIICRPKVVSKYMLCFQCHNKFYFFVLHG